LSHRSLVQVGSLRFALLLPLPRKHSLHTIVLIIGKWSEKLTSGSQTVKSMILAEDEVNI